MQDCVMIKFVIMRDILRLQRVKRLILKEIAKELGSEWRGV